MLHISFEEHNRLLAAMNTSPYASIFIGTPTAGLLTGKSVRTIHNWLESGEIQGKEIPAARIPGGTIRQVDLSSIEPHMCIPLNPELVDWIQQADIGDAAALKKVGIAFSAEQYHAMAAPWIEAAAKKGEVDAMDLLSWYYLNGAGVAQDHSIAMQWLAKAAEKGLPIAKLKLKKLNLDMGQIHLIGGGVVISQTEVHIFDEK
jgi:hypothetical protein